MQPPAMDGRLGLLLAPFAQSDRPGGARQLCSDLDPLCDFEGIVDLDAKVADGTFDAGVAEQKLHRTQVPRAAVDQGRFGSTHGVRRIFEPVEANAADPLTHQPRILPRGQWPIWVTSAWEQAFTCTPPGRT